MSIATEACTGAHHRARELESRGYAVRLIAPPFVKPFIKSNKVEQQDIQATHRVREELKAHRNAKANQTGGRLQRPDMRTQSCHVRHKQFACNEEESAYGRSKRESVVKL